MRTNAKAAPDPIAAASAIVLAYADATVRETAGEGNAAPVIAMGIGISIAVSVIAMMIASTTG
ncbi:MAG TPA: hypothetical protein VGN14_16390 [Candidatus Elarobacter sp.]|jgi:hypothetical protein